MEILKVENLCKIYGKGNNQVQALNDVSFSVEKGEKFLKLSPFNALWVKKGEFQVIKFNKVKKNSAKSPNISG